MSSFIAAVSIAQSASRVAVAYAPPKASLEIQKYVDGALAGIRLEEVSHGFVMHGQFTESHEEGVTRELPGFGITLFSILLPVILMLVGSWADLISTPKSLPNNLLHFAGNSDVALLIAVLFSFWSFGASRGFAGTEIRAGTRAVPRSNANNDVRDRGGGIAYDLVHRHGAEPISVTRSLVTSRSRQ